MSYMDFNYVTPAIVVLLYLIAEFFKKAVFKNDDNKKAKLPVICAIAGIAISIGIYFFYPQGSPANNIVDAFASGGLSGFAATGFNQLFKQFSKYSGNNSAFSYCGDPTQQYYNTTTSEMINNKNNAVTNIDIDIAKLPAISYGATAINKDDIMYGYEEH